MGRFSRKRCGLIPVYLCWVTAVTGESKSITRTVCLVHYHHICQIVQFLQEMNPQHGLQFIGFVAALSFIVVRFDDPYPLRPWDDAFHLLKKLFLTRSGLRQFVGHARQTHLFFYFTILPHFSVFFFMRCCLSSAR